MMEGSMNESCLIGVERADGTVLAAGCRSDGGVALAGRRLALHWRRAPQALLLVSGGAMERLGIREEGPEVLRTIRVSPPVPPIVLDGAEAFWARRPGLHAYLLADGFWTVRLPEGGLRRVVDLLQRIDIQRTSRRMP
ncbi:protein of unknown function (plasmid) [Magnetospirillum sp. XM-1]|nr:protein of unknown function [Magnetospirillum sp. XM-1]